MRRLKNCFLFLAVGLCGINLLAQNITVTYNQEIDVSGKSAQPFEHIYSLTTSNGISLQRRFPKSPIPNELKDKKGKTFRVVKTGEDTSYVFKDFNTRKLYSQERIHTTHHVVADDLDIFNWKILPDTLTILNFSCRRAVTTFRGRNYEAYFAEDIPVPDGPAKFNGLPGLILKVKILDDGPVYNIVATKITISPDPMQLVNPFAESKVLDHPEFVKRYKKKYDELEAFSRGDGQTTTYAPGIEILR